MRLVNLTGHELKLTDGSAIVVLPSEGRARVISESSHIGDVELTDLPGFHVPITRLVEKEVVNLPPPTDGTLFVVSGIVAAHSPRMDVVAPGRLLRDKITKQVIGCQGFVKPTKENHAA